MTGGKGRPLSAHEVKVAFVLCNKNEDGILAINNDEKSKSDENRVVSLTDSTDSLRAIAKEVTGHTMSTHLHNVTHWGYSFFLS